VQSFCDFGELGTECVADGPDLMATRAHSAKDVTAVLRIAFQLLQRVIRAITLLFGCFRIHELLDIPGRSHRRCAMRGVRSNIGLYLWVRCGERTGFKGRLPL